jgi:hypothetical protein
VTPEQRADATYAEDEASSEDFKTILVRHIRDAENDAIERAAQIVDRDDPHCCYVDARDIRLLKHA